ncbi:MAG: ATP-binding protein [Erysipelotrichaceae bacterium]|nr:ATP-binding protein [Erysipelotrichaceae bacterium]
MLKRKFMSTLERWKETKNKNCLLVKGVRQCGKTFIIREFGKARYERFIEVNFISKPEMKSVFNGNLDVDTMIQGIKLIMGNVEFIPGKTLLFLDEIQECPNARTSLKFWAEDNRIDVVASGSLLGIDYKNIVSIPVGYETQVDMYPLDFEEFLWAEGIQPEIIDELDGYISGNRMIPDAIHNGMLKHFKEYMVVGGMPDVVNTYMESRDYYLVQGVQDRILRDYQDDIAKYAENSERIKARNCYQSIPAQLSKENHKFQFSLLEKKGTSRKYESSLEWLTAAGLVVSSHNVSAPWFPLIAYKKEDQFRIYLSDIGLFTAMFGFQMKQAILHDTLEGPAKGGIYESAIADLFYKAGLPLYYFKKEDSTLELEFLLEQDARIVPVEVKAKRGTSRSLNEILKNDSIPKGYKLTSQNTGVVEKKITLPFYMGLYITRLTQDASHEISSEYIR